MIFRIEGEPIKEVVVGRFETLAIDWAYVAGRLNVDRKLKHLGASSHDHYTTYYDEESIEIVRTLYAEEIAALGYGYGK